MAEMMVFVGAQLRRPRDGHEQWCAERQASRLAFLCVSLRFFAFLCVSLIISVLMSLLLFGSTLCFDNTSFTFLASEGTNGW
jgi:hypothetical protein